MGPEHKTSGNDCLINLIIVIKNKQTVKQNGAKCWKEIHLIKQITKIYIKTQAVYADIKLIICWLFFIFNHGLVFSEKLS